MKFLIIIMCAIITLDFQRTSVCCFRGKRKMPVVRAVRSTAAANYEVLIVYCLENVTTDQACGIAQMAGVLTTAISYK